MRDSKHYPGVSKVFRPRPQKSSHTEAKRYSREIIEFTLKVVPTITAIAYGLLRSGYVAFYDEFNIKPSDIGISQADILADSLTASCVITLLLAVPYSIGAIGVFHGSLIPLQRNRDSRFVAVTLIGTLSVAFLYAGYEKSLAYSSWFQLSESATAILLILAGGVLLGLGFRLLFGISVGDIHRRTQGMRRALVAVAAIAIFGIAPYLIILFWGAASSAGRESQYRLGPTEGYIALLLDIKVVPIAVVPQGKDYLHLCDRNYALGGLLLGTSSGENYIYMRPISIGDFNTSNGSGNRSHINEEINKSGTYAVPSDKYSIIRTKVESVSICIPPNS